LYQLIDQPVDYSAAEDYIISHYDELALLTINDVLIRNLYKMKVITLDEKKSIKNLNIGERMEYLLDYIITPSLQAKYSEKYINLINVLKNSDDSCLKTVASQLANSLL